MNVATHQIKELNQLNRKNTKTTCFHGAKLEKNAREDPYSKSAIRFLLLQDAMARVSHRKTVETLALAGKKCAKIFDTIKKAYVKKQIYSIIRLVKSGAAVENRGGQYEHKLARTPDAIRAVERAMEGDRRLSLKDLAYETGVKQSTVYRIIRQDLGLVKKSPRWVPRLLSSEQKKK